MHLNCSMSSDMTDAVHLHDYDNQGLGAPLHLCAVRTCCYATVVRFAKPNHHFRGEGGAGCWRASLTLLAFLLWPWGVARPFTVPVCFAGCCSGLYC